MSEELKPCPFCGGAATYQDYGRDEGVWASCGTPGCENHDNWFTVPAWNRRAPRLEAESATGQKTLVIKLLREALKSLPGGTAAIGRVAISNPAYAVILQQAFAGDSDE